LADKTLSDLDDREITLVRRRNIGFVFQFFNLLPTLTAAENILLPVMIDGKNIKNYEVRLNILLELVGLTDRQGHKPDQLSGGEQQRVALARALVTEPAILLADEPTGNLDSKTGSTIMELLRRSCETLGQTVVVVTHDPKAAAYADRVVFLRDGIIETQRYFETGSDLTSRLHIILDVLEKMQA